MNQLGRLLVLSYTNLHEFKLTRACSKMQRDMGTRRRGETPLHFVQPLQETLRGGPGVQNTPQFKRLCVWGVPGGACQYDVRTGGGKARFPPPRAKIDFDDMLECLVDASELT
eukprot:GDKI01001253.1.p1 GENE.GDKI01001253.1~~GDKI01001253.1.p1  ORF type:complete len:113 (-),score=19.14 GDKI01001253.1:19-357(-)